MTELRNGRTPQILIVEDNPGDILLTQEAWKELHAAARLHVVKNGDEALEFLGRRGQFHDAPRPDLVLVDLNLPRKDGRELLGEIKQDPAFRRTPVIVLTTSSAIEDIRHCYDLYANCYIIKPVDLDELFRVIRAIHEFWFGIVRLPSGD